MTPSFDDDDDESFDVEPGTGVQLHAPHPVFVSFCSMLVISLFFVSYGSEYFQEMHEIAALKLATPFTDACLEGETAESFSWLHRLIYHASGLQDITERECWNQRRVASMLRFPNPLSVEHSKKLNFTIPKLNEACLTNSFKKLNFAIRKNF